jgi:putative Mg2+ transporter-C (MgtC) family protein
VRAAVPGNILGMQEPADILARLAIATVLGAIVGLERERAEQSAGLRTHALVSLGAALFMVVSAYGFSTVLGSHVILDPSRIAAQVASGIGFLGAGTIILRRQFVRGLTTAATIWTVAAIGLATGAAMYAAAVAATALVLIVLAGMHRVESVLFCERGMRILLRCDPYRFPEEAVRRTLDDAGATVETLELRFDNEKEEDCAELILRHGADPAAMTAALRRLDGVREVRTAFQGTLRGRAVSKA